MSYLRANRRRVLWMIVAPIFAAEAALLLFAIGPQEYKVTAVVNVPSSGSSVSDATQTVNDYRAIVKTEKVVRQVAAETGLSAGAIRGGIATKRDGTSTLVNVTFASDKKEKVSAVAKAVSRVGLSALVQPDVEEADRALTKAQTDAEENQQQIIEFNAARGLLVDAPEAYRSKVAELSRLKVQAQQARAQNNPARVASLDAAVEQATKDVSTLSTIVRDYQRLQAKRDQLQSTINSAAAKQSEAQARLTAVNASSSIDVGGLQKVNIFVRTARAAAITFVVALLLMVGVLVLMELLGPARSEGLFAPGAPPGRQDVNDRPAAPTPKSANPRNQKKKRR